MATIILLATMSLIPGWPCRNVDAQTDGKDDANCLQAQTASCANLGVRMVAASIFSKCWSLTLAKLSQSFNYVIFLLLPGCFFSSDCDVFCNTASWKLITQTLADRVVFIRWLLLYTIGFCCLIRTFISMQLQRNKTESQPESWLHRYQYRWVLVHSK